MVLKVIATLASVLVAVWIVFLMLVNKEDWRIAAYNKVLQNLDQIDHFELKEAKNKEKLSAYSGVTLWILKQFYDTDFSKKITKLNKENEKLQKGKLSGINILIMPGYAIQRVFQFGQNSSFLKMVQNFSEFNGKKYAIYRAKALFAGIFSYLIIGSAVSLIFAVLFIPLMGMQKGAMFSGGIFFLVIVLVYAQYDDIKDKLNKRRRAISRQFPNVVSKLALLVTSGMIMSKAWEETANSQNSELYLEMRKTAKELNNLVAPEVAYTNFIDRCNTKETAKLASAIIQNLSKGNAEIGRLLKSMASEAWEERQQTAKKDGEKANSLLMIPTMLLFISILIMIIMPAMTNMNI